jgi:hypothetical protein
VAHVGTGSREEYRTYRTEYSGIHAASLHDMSFSRSEAAEAISGVPVRRTPSTNPSVPSPKGPVDATQ